MLRTASVITSLVLAIAVFAGGTPAQTAQLPVTPQPLSGPPQAPAVYYGPQVQHPTGGQFPWVASLKPYTAQTSGMSLEGFLRYLVFQQTGKWITLLDATRVVQQQKAQ
jgi:hypothetical protein